MNLWVQGRLVLTCLALWALWPTSLPAADQKLDSQAIPRRAAATTDASSRTTGGDFGGGMVRVVLALALVLALVLALRWLGKRYMASPAAPSGGAVSVVARTALGPRQQLLLIQVGRRLVLAANTGAQINTLCEVADPQEVAEILQRVGGGSSFQAELQRAVARRGQAGAAEVSTDPAPPRLDELVRKMRGLSESFDQRSQGPPRT